MTALRILYVDDEPDIREVEELALGLDAEFETRTCDGGAEAIRLAEEWRPDLVLLDVMMPGMDGPTTLERLRQGEATQGIPVVFITARAREQDTERLLGLGARGVIAKPFDPMTLAASVREYLQ